MQTFRPAEVDLESLAEPAGGFEGVRGPEAPVTRSAVKVESPEGGLRSGVWEASSGQREFVFSYDEWAYILEGEAHVTASGSDPRTAGRRRLLRAGRGAHVVGRPDVCPQGLGPPSAAPGRPDQAQAAEA